MSKEDFRKLLSQWANEDVCVGQLTWEEGDALAERLANWYASQHGVHPTSACCRAEIIPSIRQGEPSLCSICGGTCG